MTSPFPGGAYGQVDLRRPADRAAILWLLGFALLLGLLAYGYLVFNVTLSIDQEMAGFDVPHFEHWLAQGRWTTWLMSCLLIRNPVMPVVPMSIAILGLAGSWVVTAVTWRWPVGWAHYLGAPFAICFPILVHALVFLDLSFAIGVGELLASIGIWLMASERRGRRALAILPLAAATACYQPVLLCALVSGLVFVALRIPAEGCHAALLRIGRLLALLLLALAAYYAIWQILLAATGVSVSYIDRFFHLGDLWRHPGPILGRAFAFAWSMLSGGADVYLEKRRVLALTMLLAAVLVLLWAWRACDRHGDRLLLVATVAAFVGAPLLVVAGNVGSLPYRTLLGVPIGFAGLVFLAGSADRPRFARPLLTTLCALCFLGFINGSNRLLYLQSLTAQADRDLANHIMDRAYALGLPPGDGPIAVEFVGAHAMPPSPFFPRIDSSTLGASIFEWDGGSPYRINALMRSMGVPLATISTSQRAALQPRIAAMPAWPQPGSVQLVDGILVVKLSDYTPRQRMRYGLSR